MRFVRTLLAKLLLFVISFPLLAPAFEASNSSIPACCRRDGKHRCSMRNSEAPAGKPSAQAQRSGCPYSPFNRSTGANEKLDVDGPIQNASIALAMRSADWVISESANPSAAFRATSHTRGPPASRFFL